MLKSNRFLAGKCLPIFVELDFRVGLRIFKIGATDSLVLLFFATIIANIWTMLIAC